MGWEGLGEVAVPMREASEEEAERAAFRDFPPLGAGPAGPQQSSLEGRWEPRGQLGWREGPWGLLEPLGQWVPV